MDCALITQPQYKKRSSAKREVLRSTCELLYVHHFSHQWIRLNSDADKKPGVQRVHNALSPIPPTVQTPWVVDIRWRWCRTPPYPPPPVFVTPRRVCDCHSRVYAVCTYGGKRGAIHTLRRILWARDIRGGHGV